MRNLDKVNPLLREYIIEWHKACNKWRIKTKGKTKDYIHPISYGQWKKQKRDIDLIK